MSIYHSFLVTLKEYVRLGRKNAFPIIEQCPSCHAYARLYGHGYYERHACENETAYLLVIRRLRCRACGITISILPDFLLPYYQNTLQMIIGGLRVRMIQGKKSGSHRQIYYFYEKRYCKQIKKVEMFFRDLGWRKKLPDSPIEKAMKLLEMITSFGEATFIRRFTDHFSQHFMA